MAWTNDPSGTGLLAVPANGGTGYQSWTSTETGGTEGVYATDIPYYNSSLNIYPNLSSADTQCFRMWAPSIGGVSRSVSANRKLYSPLSIGNGDTTGTVSVRLGINFRNGEKGVMVLRNGTTVTGFRAADPFGYQIYNGHTSTWSTLNSITYPYYADSVFSIELYRYQIVSTVFLTMQVYRINYEGDSTPIADYTPPASFGNTDIDELIFFCGGVDNTSSVYENSLFFNYLTGYSAYR